MPKVISTHSTWISGSERFADWLARQPGVSHVRTANIRTRKVGHGKRPPTFVSRSNGIVIAQWFADGAVQRFVVHLRSGPQTSTVVRNLQASWTAEQKRGGTGESPKDPVVLPPRIQRLLAAPSAPVPRPASTDAPQIPAPPEPTPTVPEVTVSAPSPTSPEPVPLAPRAELVYRTLCEAIPIGAVEHAVQNHTTLLRARLGVRDFRAELETLRTYGLIGATRMLRTFPATSELVVRRLPYRSIEGPPLWQPAGSAPRRRATKPATPKRAPAAPPPDNTVAILEFFARHHALLETAEQFRRVLHEQGLDISIVDGEAHLHRKRTRS